MQIQLSTEFALHGLLYLASSRKQSPTQLPDIAVAIQVKESYLRKLFQQMTKSGLLEAFKGAGGGYLLRKTPDEISLYDVLESIEGSGNWFRCYATRRHCELGSKCPVHTAFDEAFDLFTKHLRGISLGEIMRDESFKFATVWTHKLASLRAS